MKQLYDKIARVRLMKKQCEETRKDIQTYGNAMQDEAQENIEALTVSARRGNHEAESKVTNYLKAKKSLG